MFSTLTKIWSKRRFRRYVLVSVLILVFAFGYPAFAIADALDGGFPYYAGILLTAVLLALLGGFYIEGAWEYYDEKDREGG